MQSHGLTPCAICLAELQCVSVDPDGQGLSRHGFDYQFVVLECAGLYLLVELAPSGAYVTLDLAG